MIYKKKKNIKFIKNIKRKSKIQFIFEIFSNLSVYIYIFDNNFRNNIWNFNNFIRIMENKCLIKIKNDLIKSWWYKNWKSYTYL